MKRVIITGASGFIGRNFVLNLPKDWEAVALYNRSEGFPDFVRRHNVENCVPVKCNLTEFDEVAQTARRFGKDFDVCVYLAANGNPSVSVDLPVYDLQTNVIGLIHFIQSFSIRRFIYMSSGSVYLGLKGSVSPDIGIPPKLPYAISKLACEHYLRFFKSREGFMDEYVILRFFGAYGPYEPSRKLYTQLVNTFYFEGKDSFTVRGDGLNYIDAMYVDDAIACLLKVAQSDIKNKTLDFCKGSPMTIDALVVNVADTFGKSFASIVHAGRTEEPIKFRASPTALNRLIGFEPAVELSEGLRKLKDHLEDERR